MPDLDEEKYSRLKEDIDRHGVEYPILRDSNDEIIDGHHRVQAWVDLGRDPDELPARVVDDTDADNYHRAYRSNLLRRDLADGTKREVVKQYLLEHPDRATEDTHTEIASDLGVSRETVRRGANELERDGKLAQVCELTTDEKREQVREYVEDNPTASDREVSREVDCDVSHVSVGDWRDEWDTEEPTTELDTFTNSKREAETAVDVVNTATDPEANESVRETASEKVTEMAEGESTPDEAARDVQREETQRANEQRDSPDVPDGEYAVLYADPPWQYDHQKAPNRDIENHYGTMSLSDICGLDVPAASDSVLYLWATAPKLQQAFEVIDAWGFEYVTGAVWDKQKIGMGYWFRGQHEHLLVAKRGDISPPNTDARRSSVISADRGEHSAKPDSVYDLIESAFPHRDRLELFARDGRNGWDMWGDEIE
jgi:N6-adenosine-specific RNA methylase IME4/Trp operon repressor